MVLELGWAWASSGFRPEGGGVFAYVNLVNFMDRQYATTKMEKISESALAEAIEETADVDHKEAVKLARMYFRFSDNSGDETLKEVIDNLEIDADLEVLQNSKET